ncbi:DNA methyltransferase [Halocalculus aciditolerans]|uniref:Methyltransferase n=1 Tax=Halocalculus aciditolerans TaxID=1383812 RepID=A0A830FBE7_9EURY|nr:DNA methyltransferase [Halocalculus aciditolerans]GGL57828.1 methyltransferase [Halocalculus aciditolerans]
MTDDTVQSASDIERERVLERADAFEAVRGLKADSAQAAVVDYPWTFANETRPGAAEKSRPDDWQMVSNDRLPAFLEALRPALEPGSWVFVFADDDVLPAFRRAVEEAFTFRKTLIWDCERIGLGHYYRSEHGYLVGGTVGETDRYAQSTGTVFEAVEPARQPGRADTYPTEKPASLLRDVLEPVLSPGERVLEPFCGSAPTLEAARDLGLHYWGVDVSEAAIERARRRGGQTVLPDAERGESDS